MPAVRVSGYTLPDNRIQPTSVALPTSVLRARCPLARATEGAQLIRGPLEPRPSEGAAL